MSRSSDSRKDTHENSDDPNVIQLGFNISVSGKSASDFEIYVNDKKQSCGQLSIQNSEQKTSSAEHLDDQKLTGEKSTERLFLDKLLESEEPVFKDSCRLVDEKSPLIVASGEAESNKSSRSEDVRIIDEIKSAMGNFEKFSEHLREIPRLSTKKIYTSTPFPDKNNSRSEGNLSLYGNVPRSYIPKHDFRDRKYFKKPKPLSNELFLKPLPAEDYFKKGFIRRYYDMESYHRYSSMENLPNYYEYGGEWKNNGKTTAKSDNDKSDALSSSSDICPSDTKALSKKGDGNEVVDKQSTSSESTKDIKIYQSGGIIIMQNFKDSTDLLEKDFVNGVKLIDNCNKLKEKLENSLHSSDESQKLLLNSSSDDVKGQSTKSVQFDLSSFENNRSKSCDSSLDMQKNDISSARSETSKGKDTGFLFPQTQDFTSLSTQENESIMSNLIGMSPTSSTSGKKLEWDSGADVGYLNMDLTKENISTIERIVLKGLSDDGSCKKQGNYQRSGQDKISNTSKFILERMPSELELEMKNNSASKRSNSDQSSIPIGMAENSTATSQSTGSGEEIRVSKERSKTECKGFQDSRIEKYQKSGSDKTNGNNRKSSKKFKVGKSNEDAKLSKSGKCFHETKNKEMLSDFKSTHKEEKFAQTSKLDTKKEMVLCSDKSTYVNTLFDDVHFDLPIQDLSRSDESGRSESSERFGAYRLASPKMRKLTKKKNTVHGTNLSARPKDKTVTPTEIEIHSDGSNGRQKSNRSDDNIAVEKIQKIGDANDVCKHVDSETKSLPSVEKTNQADKAARSLPISASSSSIHTVMHNVEAPESDNILQEVKSFSDQIIQTCELIYESKGIQAFQSAKCSAASSQLGEGTPRNLGDIFVDRRDVKVLEEEEEGNCKSTLVCTKSIQAPGMNSSLPKHLAHPKQNILWNQINTKSTQFFGGPVTSLPNYHSNLPLREMIVAKDKILKGLENSDSENIRIIQENIRNCSVKKSNDKKFVTECEFTFTGNTNSKLVDGGSDEQQKRVNREKNANKNNVENKENLSADDEKLTDYSVHKSIDSRRKESRTNCSINSGSKKSDSLVFGSCEVLPSDDGKNLFLTSELLKEHGDLIDRNIIQEKYFQSQLLELGKMEMISRTTSMEKKSQHERNTQTCFSPVTGISVSCQYSPSLINESDEMIFYSKTDSGKSTTENGVKNAWTDQNGRDMYVPSQKQRNRQQLNTAKNSCEDELVLIESLSSDTQTADSWIPGTQQDSDNQVGKSHTIEHLQEHIYDDPVSLKEKSINKNEEQKMQLGDSVQSNGTSSTQATDSRTKNSESGRTLVLENTDGSLLESERLKCLDNNLTELEMVVSRLHEKEIIFQKITDSVLSTVSKVNGSGDSSLQQQIRSNDNSNETEEISCEVDILEESSKLNDSEGKRQDLEEKRPVFNEISTACQTDTMKPDPRRFDEEKKKLEQRMNDEKEQQIKWIENEIKHLNMLRSLLEKQEDIKIPVQKKKRHHYLTETSEESSAPTLMREEIFRKILTDSLTKTSSSAAECANGDRSKSELPLLKLNEKSLKQLSSSFTTTSECPQLGMAFSLRRIDKTREVTMLPVGVQVKLRDKANRSRAGTAPGNARDSIVSKQDVTRVKSIPTTSVTEVTTQNSNLNNQYDSISSTAKSSDTMNRCGCYKCTTSRCDCIKSSEVLDRRKSSRSGSRQSRTREPEHIFSSRELSNQELEIPEIRDITDSRRDSTNETSSGKVARSLKKDPSYMSSTESLSFEKCICFCHAQPLPRCNSCHLLNTCKKCQCYRRIKCCICEISASNVSPRKTFSSATSCQFKVGVCQLCLSCGGKNQICAICPCHMKVAPCKNKKNYKEKSCQTDGKDCNFCQSNDPLANEQDKYRETKYMSEEQHITEKRESSSVSYPSEQRFESESKQSVDEKFPFQLKVPVERKNSVEIKNATQMKTEVENLNVKQFQSLPAKELHESRRCRCNSRQSRRMSHEDHPRHYFLQVEETTEEESSESSENGSALDVITIKVPIRKVCKNGKNTQSSPVRNIRKTNEDGGIGNNYLEQKMLDIPECNCCEDCIGHSFKSSSFEKRPNSTDNWPQGVSFERKRAFSNDVDPCGCCDDCPGRAKLEERPRPEFAICDDYEQQKARSMSYTKFDKYDINDCYQNCCNENVSKPLKYPSDGYQNKEINTEASDGCNCYSCCDKVDNPVTSGPESYTAEIRKDVESEFPSNGVELSVTEIENSQPSRINEEGELPVQKNKKKVVNSTKSDKQKKGDKTKKVQSKSPTSSKSYHPHGSPKNVKCTSQDKCKDKRKNNDYYNFNKKEFMTKSELEMEEKKKRTNRLTLQECLTIKRPDLYTRAECRRKIISEKNKDRIERQNKRMDCLVKLLPQCDIPPKNPDLKLFTSAQMRKQTRKFYKKLPEVESKKEEQKKKMQFRTNKLMAEIFAKKLQLQTLNGRLNMSNSFSVMSAM